SSRLDPARADQADYYRIRVLQARLYNFVLDGPTLPAGVRLSLTDPDGKVVTFNPNGRSNRLRIALQPGTYVVGISGWSPEQAAGITYTLHVSIDQAAEGP